MVDVVMRKFDWDAILTGVGNLSRPFLETGRRLLRIRVFRVLVILMAFGFSVGGIVGGWVQMSCVLGTSCCLLLLGGWLLIRYCDFFETVRFRAGGFLALFFVGSCLYFFSPVEKYEVRPSGDACFVIEAQMPSACGDSRKEPFCTALEASSRTVASFFRSQGGLESPLDGTWRKLAYYLFQYCVLFYVVAVVFSFFSRELCNAFWLSVANRDELSVIWGSSVREMILAKSLVDERGKGKSRHKVLFKLPTSLKYKAKEERQELFDRLYDCGCLWEFVLFESPTADDRRGRRHFFLNDSGRKNIAQASRVMKAHQSGEEPEIVGILNRPRYFVRVESSADEMFFQNWISSVRDYARINIIRESVSIASDLLEQGGALPLVFKCESDQEVNSRVLLVGLGVNGRSVLNQIVENSLCIGRELEIDVVDADAAAWDEYKVRFGKTGRDDVARDRIVGPHFKIKFRMLKFGTGAFDMWLRDQISSYGRIISCLGDDGLTEDFCRELARVFKEMLLSDIPQQRVFAQVDDDDLPEEAWGNVVRFGTLKSQYGIMRLVGEQKERLGMAINRWYQSHYENDEFEEQKEKIKKIKSGGHLDEIRHPASCWALRCLHEWNETNYWSQQSSLASARGQENVLRMFGYELVSADEAGKVELLEDELDRLRNAVAERNDEIAEDEHLRWMAFHFARGVNCWNLNTHPIDKVKDQYRGLEIKANQVDVFNAHAALADFAELPKVDRELDRAKGIPSEEADKWLGQGGYSGKNGRGLCCKNDHDYVVSGKNSLQANDYMFCDLLLDRQVLLGAGLKVVKIEEQKKG